MQWNDGDLEVTRSSHGELVLRLLFTVGWFRRLRGARLVRNYWGVV